jgi:ankyrin repeat protein
MGYTALLFAVLLGHLDTVKLLIANNVCVDRKEYRYGWDALTLAVKGDEEEMVLEMLRNGTQVDPIDQRGYTPLCHVVKEPVVNSRLCILLISNGASLYTVTQKLGSYNNHEHTIQEAIFQRDLIPIRGVLLTCTSLPLVLLDIIAAYACRCPEEYQTKRRNWRQWFASMRKKACILITNVF